VGGKKRCRCELDILWIIAGLPIEVIAGATDDVGEAGQRSVGPAKSIP
jgi:hypothetical protein